MLFEAAWKKCIIPLAMSCFAAQACAVAPHKNTNDMAKTSRPNIVVVLVDDLGYADVGFQGAIDFDTPVIDSLAAGGMHFTNAYISHPYCSPSRAGIMTGKAQAHIGHEYNPASIEDERDVFRGTDVSETFISQAMQAEGYETVAIGKWHLGSHSKFLPHNRGFDEFYGFGHGSRSFWPVLTEKGPGYGKEMQLGDKIIPEEELSYLTDDLTDYAIDYVKRSDEDDPFFMYLSLNAPHAPNHAAPEDLEKTKQIMDPFRTVYAAMVVGIDRNMGRLVEALEEKGIRDNTLIVFLSDNGGRGGSDNTPLRGHKGLLYEAGIRTPLIFNLPNVIEAGRVSDTPVTALDLFPTSVALAGGNVSKFDDLHGKDLTGLLTENADASLHDRLYWRVLDGGGYAIREGDWKLVKPAARKNVELYNLAADPREMNDLSSKKPQKVKALQAAWDEWNTSGKPTAWTDAHGDNVLKEYCGVKNARVAAVFAKLRPDNSECKGVGKAMTIKRVEKSTDE